MKIILLHGDNLKESYERLSKFISVAKKRGWKVERLSGKETESIPEAISANSLFNEERLFILEDVSKASKKQLDWLKEQSKNLSGNLVVFNEGYLGKRTIGRLPKADKTEVFKHPKLIYKFLESFYPGNQKEALRLLGAIKKKQAPEYVLAVLASHLRDVYIALLDYSLLKYPNWRLGKLKSQAKKYSESKLSQIIKSLSEADFLSKTTDISIFSSLDLVIASQLE